MNEERSGPSRTAAFRAAFRHDEIGPRYSGRGHLAFTSVLSLAVVAFAVIQLEAVQPLEWLTVPLVFLYANLVEYFGHRGPMHHRWPVLGLVFHRHAQQHHRFFTNREMAFDGPRDYKAVLFPPVMIVFFIGGFALPMWLVLSIVATENAAWLAVATGIAYFLNYEWLHFAYHCPPDSGVGRNALVRRLRRLHRAHHDPALMQRHNFNITYPVGDWLFGTRWGRPGERGGPDLE